MIYIHICIYIYIYIYVCVCVCVCVCIFIRARVVSIVMTRILLIIGASRRPGKETLEAPVQRFSKHISGK